MSPATAHTPGPKAIRLKMTDADGATYYWTIRRVPRAEANAARAALASGKEAL